MSSYRCSKMEEGNDALHRQSHQLFLSDLNRFEKVAHFSPYYQSFKQNTPKAIEAINAAVLKYSHTRSGFYFSLQSKGKSNKLMKKINECNISHRYQWQRNI